MKNLISIIGRLGRDPECKYSQQGRAYGNFSVAVDDSFGDEKRTTWFTVKVFSKTAENCSRYLHKGDLVHVNGAMYNDTWTDEQGILHLPRNFGTGYLPSLASTPFFAHIFVLHIGVWSRLFGDGRMFFKMCRK